MYGTLKTQQQRPLYSGAVIYYLGGVSMSDLIRYGLEWRGPKEFIPAEMDDGHWTPWHIAADKIEELDSQNLTLRKNIESVERIQEKLEAENNQFREALHDIERLISRLFGEVI